MDVFKDDRFKHIANDPKFRNVPRKDRKIKIDKRFEAMFTDDKFKLKYSVDQRGRPIKHSQIEDLKKYYELSEASDEEVEKAVESANEDECDDSQAVDAEGIETDLKTVGGESFNLKQNQIERSKLTEKVLERLKDISVDYARGEGILDTDSSSSDEPTSEDSEEEIEHDWGELDKDAEQTEEATKRLAVCHMDWDRVTATDIMVLLHSFLPPTGFIESVTVYPSDFGLQRMKEEEIKGPQELTATKMENIDDKSADEDDEYHREKLRQYQMKRLKYYYAVVVFDSDESANKVYSECDKMEYESSATRLDLRFIPDDMTFDQDPREICTSLPEAGKYKPRLFLNTALQQEKVELTWDETDPNRIDLNRRIAQGDNISDADLKAYIATSSSEDDNEEEDFHNDSEDDNRSKGDDISRYRSLLANIQEEEEKKKKGKVEMEISWDLALENRTKEIEEKQKTESLTPFERMIKNKKEKKKSKYKKESDSDNLLSDDDLPSDIDTNDPFFKDELGDRPKKNKKKNKDHKKCGQILEEDEDGDATRRKAELELLLAEDGEEESRKKHFNLKAIQEREAYSNKKMKKKTKGSVDNQEDDFKIDLKDDRFNALFTSHLYNIDPADSHFKKTKAMDDIIAEKSKRRKDTSQEVGSAKKQKLDNPQLSAEITQLLSSVKKKAKLNKR